MKYLPELLVIVGLLIVLAGVFLTFGLPATLLTAGVAFVVIGVVLDRNRKG